jgi:uncharacterized protein YktA (UPF0223 family)
MAVKPPVSESWPQKDHIDTIDFLPTIARLADEGIPEYCRGEPIQLENGGAARITERIYPDWYSVSVEADGIKGIFTYDSNYPNRPNKKVFQNNAELEEFYRLSSVRTGNDSKVDIQANQKNKLRQLATDFLVSSEHSEYKSKAEVKRPSQETIEHLQNLGYK